MVTLIETLPFPRFFKIVSNFSRKFGQPFIKIWKYAFVAVRLGRAPDTEFIKNIVKNQWKSVTFADFHKLC